MHFGKCHLSFFLNSDRLPTFSQRPLKGTWSTVLLLQAQTLKLLAQNIRSVPTNTICSKWSVLARLSQSHNKGRERHHNRWVVGHVSQPSRSKNPRQKCQNLKNNPIYRRVSTQLPLQIAINFKMFTRSPPTTLPQPMVNASHSWILMCTLFPWRTEAVLEAKHSLRGWWLPKLLIHLVFVKLP